MLVFIVNEDVGNNSSFFSFRSLPDATWNEICFDAETNQASIDRAELLLSFAPVRRSADQFWLNEARPCSLLTQKVFNVCLIISAHRSRAAGDIGYLRTHILLFLSRIRPRVESIDLIDGAKFSLTRSIECIPPIDHSLTLDFQCIVGAAEHNGYRCGWGWGCVWPPSS